MNKSGTSILKLELYQNGGSAGLELEKWLYVTLFTEKRHF